MADKVRQSNTHVQHNLITDKESVNTAKNPHPSSSPNPSSPSCPPPAQTLPTSEQRAHTRQSFREAVDAVANTINIQMVVETGGVSMRLEYTRSSELHLEFYFSMRGHVGIPR